MAAILVFDGDNTLWDTNGVFFDTQVALLSIFANAGISLEPRLAVPELRKLDGELARRLRHYEYDFRYLAYAVREFWPRRLSCIEAVERAIENAEQTARVDDDATIASAVVAMESGLSETPALLPGSDELFEWLSESNRPTHAYTALYSEGVQERVQRILAEHGVSAMNAFDDIVIREKSVEGFECILSDGATRLSGGDTHGQAVPICIGDSLHRDIRFANEAGFTTIYKPAGFHGIEIPTNEVEQPDYVVDDLMDLIPRLKQLGIRW